MKKPEISFNPDKHQYTLNGRHVPGVTNIIAGTLGISWAADDWYLERGQAVHAGMAFLSKGIEINNDPRIDGQLEAGRKYLREIKPTIVDVELIVYSVRYQYAGTLDMVHDDDGLWIVDYKASLDDNVFTQLALYAIAFEETYKRNKVKGGYGVKLGEDGRYKLTERVNLKSQRNEALACRTVYGIKQQRGLLKNEQRNN